MLSCEHYDYIEIACMHRYPVKLQLTSGTQLSGTAIDTARNENKQECLLLQTADGDSLVVLDDLVNLVVTVDNPHFASVEFKEGGSAGG